MKNPDPKDKADLDNHANQLNDNNDTYWKSRGLDEKPKNQDVVNDIDFNEDCDDIGSYTSESD
ncbi:MAG TPA: hypothetical protein VNG53_02470 [Bacteroidia bacterium]|nr:hypothetical protein [Bacteroidia bacterium]